MHRCSIASYEAAARVLACCVKRYIDSIPDPGTLIVLRSPYPWRVEEPSIYESVRVHTAVQTGRTENDLVPIAPSVRPFPLPLSAILKPHITQEAPNLPQL